MKSNKQVSSRNPFARRGSSAPTQGRGYRPLRRRPQQQNKFQQGNRPQAPPIYQKKQPKQSTNPWSGFNFQKPQIPQWLKNTPSTPPSLPPSPQLVHYLDDIHDVATFGYASGNKRSRPGPRKALRARQGATPYTGGSNLLGWGGKGRANRGGRFSGMRNNRGPGRFRRGYRGSGQGSVGPNDDWNNGNNTY